MSLFTGLFLADSLHTSHSHSVQFVSMRPRQSDSSVPHFPYSTPAGPLGAAGAAVILDFSLLRFLEFPAVFLAALRPFFLASCTNDAVVAINVHAICSMAERVSLGWLWRKETLAH